MENNAVKITVTCDDGTTKDLYTVVSAAIEMGVKLGMFNTES